MNIRCLLSLLLIVKYIHWYIHGVYDMFNSEKKFNKRIEKSWYNIVW